MITTRAATRHSARIAGALAGAALLTILAACSGSGSSSTAGSAAVSATPAASGSASSHPTASGGDFVIGVTDDMSGPVSSYGQNVRKVWTAFVDSVNAAGGVDGRKIKLVFLDDKSDATLVATNVRSLIAQGAILVTSSTLSGNCAIGANIAIADRTPLSCWAANPEQMDPVNKFVFERFPTEAVMSKPMIDFASKVTTAGKRMAIAAGTSGGAQIWMKNTARLAAAQGWTITGQDSVDLSQGADVTSLASKIQSGKPDVLLFEITQPASNQLVQQLRTLGVDIPVINLFEDVPGLDQLEDASYYQMFSMDYVPAAPTTDAAKTYVKDLASQGIDGANINLINVGLNYAGIAQIVASLKACGSDCDRASLADAMAKTTVTLPGVTLAGGFGYSATSHIPVRQVEAYGYDTQTKQPKPMGVFDVGSLAQN